MKTLETLDALQEADERAVREHLMTGKPLDSEVAIRVRERAQRITDELREKHGEMNIAVDLIRQARDEE